MTEYADLELSLCRAQEGGYAVEMRFCQPESDTDIRLGQGGEMRACFEFERLLTLTINPPAYGKLLSEQLFGDPTVRSEFAKARASAQTLGAPLRLRLRIDFNASELHNLHWETLLDPEDGSQLCSGGNVFFSRYLSSSTDWRRVQLRSRASLKALLVAANPANLSEYSLAPVDVQGELDRVCQSLKDIANIALPDPYSGKLATLENIVNGLQDGCDILYLVCHGALVKNQPWLYLEDDQGQVAIIPGSQLAAQIQKMNQCPRLIVLASCQSAGDTSGQALLALGPLLSGAGVPAVVAMQGKISMETVAQWMPVFFKELNDDGQIDRALSVARQAVWDRPDYWMPVLFMRLKSGRIWYTPGFGEEGSGFGKWPAVVRSIKMKQCTPILGGGLLEAWIGSNRELAKSWADSYSFPMRPSDRESLPAVAQYLAVNQNIDFPRFELLEYLRKQAQEHLGPHLPPELKGENVALESLLKYAGGLRRQAWSAEPYRILAELPFEIYITANCDRMLEDALVEAHKEPQVDLCPWNQFAQIPDSVYLREPNYTPSVQRPLVYYLFGRMDIPQSMVLTQDDFFDFMIGFSNNKELVPPVVRNKLASTALLFVGFSIDEWDFRVIFRNIMSLEGRRRRLTNVGVQLELDETQQANSHLARHFLEGYSAEADVSLYWGSAEDFLKDLQQQFANPGPA